MNAERWNEYTVDHPKMIHEEIGQQMLRSERVELAGFTRAQLFWPAQKDDVITSLNGRYDKDSRLIMPEQVHGNKIAYVDITSNRKIAETDGLITKDPNVVLLAQSADCPVIIASDGNIRGIAHSGRLGTEQRIGQKLIREMELYGADLQAIEVRIGPGIQKSCYKFRSNDPRVDSFDKQFSATTIEYRDAHGYLDLHTAIEETLLDAGLTFNQITIDKRCTHCHPENFPSHRRDGSLRKYTLISSVTDSNWINILENKISQI